MVYYNTHRLPKYGIAAMSLSYVKPRLEQKDMPTVQGLPGAELFLSLVAVHLSDSTGSG